MQWGIKIVLTITLYGLDSPSTVLTTAPWEILQRSHCTMFGPVHHISSAPQQPVVHKETCRTLLVHIGDILGRGIMRSIEEQSITYYQWRWVGSIFGLEQRHVHLLQSTHLPPVEVKQFWSLTTFEHQINVGCSRQVQTRNGSGWCIDIGDGRVIQINGNGLPLLPATCTRHVQGAQTSATDTVEMNLNSATTQTTGHTGCERTWILVGKGHILQFDIVAIVDVTDINPYLVVLFSLHTFREGHGLSLHLAIRVKHANRLHACIGGHNLWETAIGIVLKLLNSYTTTETATIWQFTCMVEEIAMTFIIGHTTVVGKRVGIAQRHNLASILPGTCWRWCSAIRDMFGHTTSGIQQLICTIALG